jgi:hypothetical protein
MRGFLPHSKFCTTDSNLCATANPVFNCSAESNVCVEAEQLNPNPILTWWANAGKCSAKGSIGRKLRIWTYKKTCTVPWVAAVLQWLAAAEPIQ